MNNGNWVISGAIFLTVTLLWVTYALNMVHPGHADPAFYLSAARSLYLEGDFTIPLLWHFTNGTPEINHYAFDYCAPGVSSDSIFIDYFSLNFTGLSYVSMALMPPLFLGLVLSFLAPKLLTKFSVEVPWYSPALFFSITMAAFAIDTLESPPYHGFILSIFVLVLAAGIYTDRLKFFLLASVFAGIDRYFRGDAILLLPMLMFFFVAFRTENVKTNAKEIIVIISLYLAALLPLLILNFTQGGWYFTSASPMLLLRDYADLFALQMPDFEAFSDLGWNNILRQRLSALKQNTLMLLSSRYSPIGIVLVLFALSRHSFNRDDYLGILLTISFALVMTYALAYSFLFPFFNIALAKSTVVLMHFGIALSAVTCRNWSQLSKPTSIFFQSLLVLLALHPFLGTVKTVFNAQGNIEMAGKMQNICDELLRTIPTQSVVMTRNVWQLSWSCPDYQMIQIPSDSFASMGIISSKYDVRALIVSYGDVGRHAKYLSDIDLGRQPLLDFSPISKTSVEGYSLSQAANTKQMTTAIA